MNSGVVSCAEAQELPEPLRGGHVRVVARRVEDVVEPALRLGEALVLAQVRGDEHRRVEEQLPVVDRVRPVVGDVDLVLSGTAGRVRPGRVDRRSQRRLEVGVVLGVEQRVQPVAG